MNKNIKKTFFLLVCLINYLESSTQNYHSKINQLEKAVVDNDADTVQQLLQTNPTLSVSRNNILNAIKHHSPDSLLALAEHVCNNPESLQQLGFYENLNLFEKCKDRTILMHAARCHNQEVLKALLKIPSIAKSLNYSYFTTYNYHNETVYHHTALKESLITNSDVIEILLSCQTDPLFCDELPDSQQMLLTHAYNNQNQKKRLHWYHLCLQKKRPHQTLPLDLLLIIRSYLTITKTAYDFPPTNPPRLFGMGGSMNY